MIRKEKIERELLSLVKTITGNLREMILMFSRKD